MEIPIYIDGCRAGTLTIRRQSSLTRMDVRLADPGRVVRLRVYGEAGEFYLGVPAPEGGELRLTRRFTPAEMRRFPRKPRYAAEKRLARIPAEEEREAPRHVLWLGGRAFYF